MASAINTKFMKYWIKFKLVLKNAVSIYLKDSPIYHAAQLYITSNK